MAGGVLCVGSGAEKRDPRGWGDPGVEARKPDALPAQVLLHPLVPIETQLDGIRDVRADLQKGGTPVSVVDVEIEVFDRNSLPGEVEDHTPRRGAAFVGFEGAHLFLS